MFTDTKTHTTDLLTTLNAHAGLAAGFDKHAEVVEPLMQLGFGFVEIGELVGVRGAASVLVWGLRMVWQAHIGNCTHSHNSCFSWLALS